MQNQKQILSVSQLNQAAKNLLDTYLPLLWVEGEVSNFAAPSSGHWYFTLKDARAQVRCAMFKNRNMSVRFRPKAGEKVLMRAKPSLYEGRGEYQLIVEHMEPAGAGDLQRQFEELKARLQAEGLFDSEFKQELPEWPAKLGIVTSATGAAVHDVLHVLKRRFPSLPVVILPVAVQGEHAGRQIAEAIELANTHQTCDVLLVTRGGGSLEDLWAFNEEVVARAIFESGIPVISAVGHEVDFTISDFVADVRAPTPSAAAEILSANQEELAAILVQFNKSLASLMGQRLRTAKQHLNYTRARLQHPGQALRNQAQKLDQLELRLMRAARSNIAQQQQELRHINERFTQVNPKNQLNIGKSKLEAAARQLQLAYNRNAHNKSKSLAHATAMLQNLSPLNTLSRGYAIVMTKEGRAVRSVNEVKVGDQLKTRLNEGELDCQVTQVSRNAN